MGKPMGLKKGGGKGGLLGKSYFFFLLGCLPFMGETVKLLQSPSTSSSSSEALIPHPRDDYVEGATCWDSSFGTWLPSYEEGYRGAIPSFGGEGDSLEELETRSETRLWADTVITLPVRGRAVDFILRERGVDANLDPG